MNKIHFYFYLDNKKNIYVLDDSNDSNDSNDSKELYCFYLISKKDFPFNSVNEYLDHYPDIKVKFIENLNRLTFVYMYEKYNQYFFFKKLYLSNDNDLEKFSDDLISRKYKYSELKNENRFYLYNNLEREIRSIALGNSNFLFLP